MKKVIVGLGEVLWDMLPEGKKLGGAPANFAFFTGLFGNEALAVSAVGTDDLGTETLSALKSHGLEFVIPRVPFPTGTVPVELDSQGVPTYIIKEGAAWDNLPFTPEMENVARRCDAVCWGSLAQRSEVSRQSILKFIGLVSEKCLRIFDINLRGKFYTKEVIEHSLSLCNILKINDEEFDIVTKMFGYAHETLAEGCRAIIADFGLDMLVLTCGATGSYVFNAAGEMSYIATPKVEVADTVGAGDSFTGTFCSALLEGVPMKKAHRLAVDVSAYVCTQNGAMPQLPQKFIAEIKP